jgi:hypothetical protein
MHEYLKATISVPAVQRVLDCRNGGGAREEMLPSIPCTGTTNTMKPTSPQRQLIRRPRCGPLPISRQAQAHRTASEN